MRNSKHPPCEQRVASRRRFLRQAGIACSLLGALPAQRALSMPAAQPRSLSFVHTHTGETLTAAYFNGAAYDTGSLRSIDHLLRDFRTGEVARMDTALLDILWELRALADPDAPFEIISGYRSPATNAMLHRKSNGVAEHSQHLLGKAIDLRLSGYSTRTLGEQARALARGGVGYYAGSDFVHVDTGRVRFW